MPRPPVGTTRQTDSTTARFAFVCAHLQGVALNGPSKDFQARLGTRVGGNGAKRASNQLPSGTFRPWLLVNEERLGVERALVRFPGKGRRQGPLIAALKTCPGVRQVIELSAAGDVLAVLLFRGPDDRKAVRSALEEMDRPMYWDDVVLEDHDPAIPTWRRLLERAADDEGLALDPADDVPT